MAGRLILLLVATLAVVAAAGQVTPSTNPSYLLPVDPNAPPTSEFLTPESNINPLNANSQYQQQMGQAGQSATQGMPGLNPNGVPPGSLQPGNVPVGAGAGENTVTPFPQFLSVAECRNCHYTEE